MNYFSFDFYLIVLGVTVFVGLVAGIYPSLYLSKFRPVEILNERGKGSASSTVLRTILVVFQFSISVILIFATVVIYQQTDYLFNADLGYSKDRVVYMKLDAALKENAEILKTKLESQSSIETVGTGLHIPNYITWNGGGYGWEGKPEGVDPLVTHTYTDNNWWKVFGMTIVQGRGFDNKIDKLESGKVLINESFAKMIDPHGNVVGKILRRGENNTFEIIGVLKDFNYLNLRREVGPIAIFNWPNDQYLFAKLTPNNEKDAIPQITKVVKEISAGSTPAVTFFEDYLSGRFKSESREKTLAAYFAILTIIIASLGLFGLNSFIAEQKTKEIGIRKVLGATVQGIVSNLSVNFVKWILVANLIGLPLGYYLMEQWLQDYPYRIDLTVDLLAVVFISSILIAIIATGYQSVKAAVSNPVKSIRYE